MRTATTSRDLPSSLISLIFLFFLFSTQLTIKKSTQKSFITIITLKWILIDFFSRVFSLVSWLLWCYTAATIITNFPLLPFSEFSLLSFFSFTSFPCVLHNMASANCVTSHVIDRRHSIGISSHVLGRAAFYWSILLFRYRPISGTKKTNKKKTFHPFYHLILPKELIDRYYKFNSIKKKLSLSINIMMFFIIYTTSPGKNVNKELRRLLPVVVLR